MNNIIEPESSVTMQNNIVDNTEQCYPTTMLHPVFNNL